MSRPAKKPAFDSAQWTSVEPLPDWLAEHLQKAGEAEDATLGTAHSFDEEAKRYLVSRARYIVGYNRAIHENRLNQLAISDEALAVKKPVEALGLIHEAYPIARLCFDETLKDPSDDARTRASLLYARLFRLKEKVLAERQSEWPRYNDDILAILKAWSVPRDEKKALAQLLILDNPQSSQSQIAKMSEEYPERKFDQSCLSQWIISGWVLDPYKRLRPSRFLGQAPLPSLKRYLLNPLKGEVKHCNTDRCRHLALNRKGICNEILTSKRGRGPNWRVLGNLVALGKSRFVPQTTQDRQACRRLGRGRN